MDLRWGLLLVGLAVLALIYRYSRAKIPQDREAPGSRKDPLISDPAGLSGADSEIDPLFNGSPAQRAEPFAHEVPEVPLTSAEFQPDSEPEPAAESENTDAEPEPDLAPKIVALRLMAKRQGGFAADKLILALREQGLRHGQFGIFHRVQNDDDNACDFSVANLTEPGSFDLSRVKIDCYAGVSIFMMLPGPEHGVETFDDMLNTSRTLADKLDGELLDEQGIKLSIQRERYMREEVVQFEHHLK